jgi:hypothetical protein
MEAGGLSERATARRNEVKKRMAIAVVFSVFFALPSTYVQTTDFH